MLTCLFDFAIINSYQDRTSKLTNKVNTMQNLKSIQVQGGNNFHYFTTVNNESVQVTELEALNFLDNNEYELDITFEGSVMTTHYSFV